MEFQHILGEGVGGTSGSGHGCGWVWGDLVGMCGGGWVGVGGDLPKSPHNLAWIHEQAAAADIARSGPLEELEAMVVSVDASQLNCGGVLWGNITFSWKNILVHTSRFSVETSRLFLKIHHAIRSSIIEHPSRFSVDPSQNINSAFLGMHFLQETDSL